MDPEETCATFWTKRGFNCSRKKTHTQSTYLGGRVVQIVLRVGIIEVLLELHIVFLPASANHDSLDVQRTLSLDGDVDVRSTDAGRGLRHCIRLDIVACNLTGCRFPRRICDDLEQPRDVPVLVQRMIRLRGDHIKSDVVRKAVSKDRGKRCQV